MTVKETMINISEAKAHRFRSVRMVKKGSRIILCDRNRPFAEIRPLPQTGAPRPFGLARGKIHLPDDLNVPDPDVERLFAGDDKA